MRKKIQNKIFLYAFTLILTVLFVQYNNCNTSSLIFSFIIILILISFILNIKNNDEKIKILSQKNKILENGIDSSKSTFICFDKNFNCIFKNNFANKMFGINTKNFEQILDKFRGNSEIFSAFSEIKTYALSKQYFSKDIFINDSKKSIVWRIEVSPITKSDNYFLLSINDITPEIKETNDFENDVFFLNSLIDHLKLPIIITDNSSLKILYANSQFKNLYEDFDLKKESNLAKYIKETINFQKDMDFFATKILNKSEDENIVKLILKTEQLKVYTITNKEENLSMLSVIKRYELFIDYIFEESPVGITILKDKKSIKISNKTFKKIINYENISKDDDQYLNLFDFISPEDKTTLENHIINFNKNNTDNLTPVEIHFKNSKTYLVYINYLKNNINIETISNSTENETNEKDFNDYLVLYFLDISDFSDYKSQLFQSQKTQAIGQLAGGIAHDFNNLLTAMIGYSDLLLSKYSPTDPSFNDVMQIKQNASRASNLIKQLLAFSRQQKMQTKILDISDNISEISILIQRLIGTQIELKVTNGRNLKFIKVDPIQLEQILINLSVNARDAMKKGGTLTIETSNINLKTPIITNHVTIPAQEFVVLKISDTGTGIEKENLSKIFDPFFSTKEKGEGTGLGLATVFGIVKQTNAFITCESEINQGTIFKIYFPTFEKPEEIENQDNDVSTTKKFFKDLTGSETILLIEDEDSIRNFAKKALQDKGYKIIAASSAVHALELMKNIQENIDLIITDIIMPKIDGVEFVKITRQNNPNIKVIFISGYAEDSLNNSIVQDKITYFLQKPFTLKDLSLKVKEILENK